MIADLHVRKAASRARGASSSEREYHYACMLEGPHLAGHILVIPSNHYSPNLADLWKSLRFTWRQDDRQWIRDTRQPLDGRCYTAAAWLESARREFWKEWKHALMKNCPKCRKNFLPATVYETVCPNCQKGDPDQ